MKLSVGKTMLQLGWAVIFAMAASVFILSKWKGYSLLRTDCGYVEHCASSLQMTARFADELSGYGLSTEFYGGLVTAFMTIAGLASLAVGALLFRYGRKDVYCMTASLFLIITGTIFTTVEQSLEGSFPTVYGWFIVLNGIGSYYLPFLFLFPDGRFVPKWTVAPSVIWAGTQTIRHFIPGTWEELNWSPLFMTALVILTHGPLLVTIRRRYSSAASAQEKRQLKWFCFSVLAYLGTGLCLALPYVMGSGLALLVVQVAFFAGLLFWPFSIGVGMMNRRMGAGAVVLQRAIVMSTLSVLIALLYASVVGGFSLFVRDMSLLVSMAACGLAAMLAHPLYVRLQRGMNRLVYGESENPYKTLTKLAARLDDMSGQHAIWPEAVAGIALALQAPYAALVLHSEKGRTELASYGTIRLPVTEIALNRLEESLGALVLGGLPQQGETAADTAELLKHLTHQLSVAIHSARLADELQQSRERLVTAREEERRRLRRDLHDGLGAGLATVLLKADTVADSYEGDARLHRQLTDIQSGIEEAIADIRRLVHALRPPALDELGLVSALCEMAIRFQEGGVRVAVERTAGFPGCTQPQRRRYTESCRRR
ncbi:sensor histidine kinase [Cohnella faecalis]|uniref:histidine kinase n=1 Tax=Cohnella faecalis TaxID=2315694 RepID=A0A398CXJ4_9BACL|nr:histidine kinase [Cohnella faecalis]RIE03704.1 hypothetical protein D3H35_10430 [Cohnella faecalis]